MSSVCQSSVAVCTLLPLEEVYTIGRSTKPDEDGGFPVVSKWMRYIESLDMAGKRRVTDQLVRLLYKLPGARANPGNRIRIHT